jgi:hypothetical protein
VSSAAPGSRRDISRTLEVTLTAVTPTPAAGDGSDPLFDAVVREVARSSESDGPNAGDAPADEPADAETSPSANGETQPPARRRRSARRAFPALSFDEALFLANAIQEHGSGQPIRRYTLFEALNRSPDSGTARKLITSSGQYGLTTGSYTAEFLELTQLGAIASDSSSAPAAKLDAQAQLAILNVAPFKAIYEKYSGSRVPAIEVLRDAARESGVDEDEVAECVETFLANARSLELVRNIGGSEHLLTIETVVEERAKRTIETPGGNGGPAARREKPETGTPAQVGQEAAADVTTIAPSGAAESRVTLTTPLSDTCFIISPIGAEGSEHRMHADLVLASLIEPALAELGLKAVRADKISVPGLITRQVMEHVARAKLVIADLSFGNPNVYYELALRHAVRKPLVQITRTADKLPFDVGQLRTVFIDMTDIYTLVPQLELHRQEITRQCRAALADGEMAESPLSRFYPQFWDEIGRS